MRVVMINSVCLGDGVDGEPGQDYEVSEIFGASLIRRGKARPFDPETDDEGDEPRTPKPPAKKGKK